MGPITAALDACRRFPAVNRAWLPLPSARTARAWRHAFITFAFAVSCLWISACTGNGTSVDAPPADAPACVPDCAGRTCGSDGCGGLCGTCAPSLVCGVEGTCAEPDSPTPGCDQTCAEAGVQCGPHCGEDCGACTAALDACVEGKCVCQPVCSAALCEQPGGCGADCGPCAITQSCSDCVLKLQVVDQVAKDGVLSEVTLALDFTPPDGSALPTMVDLQLRATGPAELKSLGLAPALTDAKKVLFSDPDTGRPFQKLDDDVYRILVFSTSNTNTIAVGRWLLLKFKIGPKTAAEAATWALEPAVIRILQREETFAPAPADATLWAGGYSDPVVVWGQESEVGNGR